MVISLVLVVLPLGLLFLLSGLIVNAIHAILFMSVRPLSKSLYRRINRFLVELLWLQLIWLVDWWAGVKVQLHADQETYQLMGKEHALIISNHRSDIDWLIGWILAQRSGCLGSTLAIMKKSSKFLPVIGWSMWFAEYLFLERSWAKDEKTLKWGLKRLKYFPRSFWLALFVEGTRFTPAKLLAAQEYAASQGLPAPRNVLIPRTKVHVRIKRHAMSDMPKSDEDVSKWCKDIFVAKDALLDKHIATGTFDEEIRPIGRPMKSLLLASIAAARPAAAGMSTTEEKAAGGYDYDRLSELKAFDDTKAGVKGLVDAGVTTVPAIFRHHREDGPQVSSSSSSSSTSSIPVIDLSAADAAAREHVVTQVKAAAETVGFFQLVNHGVPSELLSEMLASVRRFNESPAETKRAYYTRDARRKLRFNSNFDLFSSPAANWRDTLFCEAAPEPPLAEELPGAVRHVMLEYGGAAREVAARVLALLSEALGLGAGHLAGMGCAEGLSLVCNYYPPCPEPDLTMGCSAHSDPSFLTLLLQDAHAQGGLQALLGSTWVDVPPLPGALLVNVGDLLQLVSNGRFRSVEHRVVANRSRDTARVSVACFCNADIARSTRLYGPIGELITSDGDGDGDRRAVYRSVTVPEFLAHYDKKGLDGRPALHHFQLLQ